MIPFVCMLTLLIKKIFFAFCGIFGVGFVIAFHEFGHLIFCKIFNMEAPSFSIGFGPHLISKKIGETVFSISAIPLGGYVEIAGAAEEQGPITDRSFIRKPWYQKMLVMIGGISFNIILAYIVFSLLFMVGMPSSPITYSLTSTTTIATVQPDSPAEKAGLRAEDTILEANGIPITQVKPFIEEVAAHPGIPFSLAIQHKDGSRETIVVTSASKQINGKEIGSLGVIFDMKPLEPVSFIEALQNATTMTKDMIITTFYAYKNIIVKTDVSQVGGPIMIISQTMTGASKGIKILLLFLAYISITLAILNLIPLPILDGGQMLFYTIEALIRRPIPFNVRYYIHVATWIVFMILIVFLSIKDVYFIVQPYIQSVVQFFTGSVH